jgi:hypothetical protein
MNKVELDRVIDEARFCVEDQMEEPVNIRQMTRDVARLVKFLDDFCSYPTPNEPAGLSVMLKGARIDRSLIEATQTLCVR